MKPQITIAIDGYSSSGKSSMARQLAKNIGYRYIDSGAMYRAVALAAMRAGLVDADGGVDADGLTALLPSINIGFSLRPDGSQATMLNGEDVENEIRSMAVSQCVSPVAAIPAVRKALTSMQQAMGQGGGIVMDGRDIGTTVFPQAEMKIFVDAPAQTRAQRRLAELMAKGVDTSYEEVLANVAARDHLDLTRKESPLRCASDAIRLDNTSMTLEEQDRWLLNQFNRIAGNADVK